jgi:asparagine synthase (glutamine-hydrolysing)
MTRAMAYRGPDEEGFYHDRNVSLGHRRLSIIDLSSGQQPMQSCDGEQILVFNGEIYNFLELRAELADYPFKTKSDTEVIIAGYWKWGMQVVDRLRGMFAFTIYDRRLNQIFASRDPLGKKPFYYHITKTGTFYFASDMQSLAASGMLPGKISHEAIQHYFTLGYIPAPLSIYQNVYKLKAGHALRYNSNELKTWSFWDIDFSAQAQYPEPILEEKLDDLLNRSVKRRLIADVPVGAMLSGGIDSNLVVSTMARQSTGTVRTFTAGFGEKTSMLGTRDERQAATAASEYYGVKHKNISISNEKEFILPKLLSYLGEPLADNSILPTYLICRAIRQHLKCALTGDGGDEPFGGYSFRYLPHLTEERIRNIVPCAALTPLAVILEKIWPIGEYLPHALRLNTIFRNLAVPSEQAFFLDQALRIVPDSPLLPEVVKGREAALQKVAELYNKGAGRDELTRILYVDMKLYMAEDVLVKADRMSMANSIELRAPLLDSEIVEFAFSLPDRMKIRKKECKYLLRKLAARYVDPQILNLPKTGFSIPVESYMRNSWRSDFESRILSVDSDIFEFIDNIKMHAVWKNFLQGDNSQLSVLWSAYVLSMWFSEFHRKQTFSSLQ